MSAGAAGRAAGGVCGGAAADWDGGALWGGGAAPDDGADWPHAIPIIAVRVTAARSVGLVIVVEVSSWRYLPGADTLSVTGTAEKSSSTMPSGAGLTRAAPAIVPVAAPLSSKSSSTKVS